MEDFKKLFSSFEHLRIGVIGDVMLDTYMWGHVERISPEAPVPIVSLDQKEERVGGAGNVALNLQSLGAKAYVISVTGDDKEAETLQQQFTSQQINAAYVLKSKERLTTNKTRIISRNQQMMRLDSEITSDLSKKDEEKLKVLFEQFIEREKPDVVILQDYNKGVLTSSLISFIITACKKAGVITAVDPKRKNFFEYKNVDLFKPNLKEVKEALNILFTDVDFGLLQKIHLDLQTALHHKASLITLSEKGVFYSEKKESAIISSHIRNVADVSGAGDTVIAVAALVYAATKDLHMAAEIANIAGGLVCEEVGTVAIDKLKLLHECELLLHNLH